MGRKLLIADDELMDRLSHVFRDVGFEGATLALLASAAGLKKASLYHRFPGGKEQMAREVLLSAGAWIKAHVLDPLSSESPPAARIQAMARRLDEFYAGGREACLLNVMSSSRLADGPFNGLIRNVLDAWISALTTAMTDAGIDRKQARARAERALIMLQGSLVVARGLGTTRPFRDYLKVLPEELLRDQR